MSAALKARFEAIHNSIWSTFDEIFEDQRLIDFDGLSSEQLAEMHPLEVERMFAAQSLRAFATSCLTIAQRVWIDREAIDHSPRVAANLERTADFSEQYASRYLEQLRLIQQAYKDAAHG